MTPQAKPNPTARLVGELAIILAELCELQDRLREAIDAKLTAMRKSDVEQMGKASAREGELVGRVARLDDRRRKVVADLCKAVGMPAMRNPGDVSLRTLIAQLPADHAERLTDLANALRDKMLHVAEANRVVGMVSQAVLDFYKELFSIIAHDENGASIYSDRGTIGKTGDIRVLDAVI